MRYMRIYMDGKSTITRVFMHVILGADSSTRGVFSKGFSQRSRVLLSYYRPELIPTDLK